jgi:hypothetical protein
MQRDAKSAGSDKSQGAWSGVNKNKLFWTIILQLLFYNYYFTIIILQFLFYNYYFVIIIERMVLSTTFI